MLTYFSKIEKEQSIYTVDMCRFRTDLTMSDFSKIETLCKISYCKLIEKEYISHNLQDFKYNYNIKISENSSYWFGFIHNSEVINKDKSIQNENTKYNFTIEFNPNKVENSGLLKYILNITNNWIIKSIDMAIDIPINILDLCGMDKKRKKDFRLFSQGGDNRTYYFGRTNNRIKIYNKKIESNLERDLTRVEITSKIDLDLRMINYFNYDVELPELFLNEYLYTFKDYEDKTLLAVLYAVQNGFELHNLTRRYKDKVLKLLNGGYKIKLYNECCTQAIRLCINTLFEKSVI